jgi:hypothetical protein
MVKARGKVVPAHAMKAYRGKRVTVPLILNPGSRGLEGRRGE